MTVTGNGPSPFLGEGFSFLSENILAEGIQQTSGALT